MKPEQAEFALHAMFLPALKNEHRITSSVIQAIPRDKGDYRPDEISRSALDLGWHIAATEMRFMDAVANGGFDYTSNPMPQAIKNSADLAEWYGPEFEKRLTGLSKLSAEQLTKVIDFRGMFQFPAVQYLAFLLHHTVHHRGQLSTYLRPMGAKVPSIYGESYDAAQARMVAQRA